jgi:hypothetical protein
MLDRAWLRLTRLDLRLQKFYVVVSCAMFSMAWLALGARAIGHWQAVATESHIWVIFLLWLSLALWIGLLRGTARRSGAIGCLAGILWAAGELWFPYLR